MCDDRNKAAAEMKTAFKAGWLEAVIELVMSTTQCHTYVSVAYLILNRQNAVSFLCQLLQS